MRLRTALFFSALPFRSKLYRSTGWPSIQPQAEPHRFFEAFLRTFFSRSEIIEAINRADAYLLQYERSETLHAVLIGDEEYPPLLKQIFDPPPVLFMRGADLPQMPCFLSVVGTRYPDRISIDAVDRFVERLACAASLPALYRSCIEEPFPVDRSVQLSLFEGQATVAGDTSAREEFAYRQCTNYAFMPVTVSGFAFGIDERIHRASIFHRIPTLAVLGSGVDHITPATNRYLLEEAGSFDSPLTFLSEFFPDELPRRFAYPRRNRIIAGLSPLCIVFQAANRSGALITARFAIEEGREVIAFDHPLLKPAGKNEGARALLDEGASRLVLFPER